MNNSEKPALPTTSMDSPEEKQQNPSYWLTEEEIKGLHEDAKRSQEILSELMKKLYGDKLMLS